MNPARCAHVETFPIGYGTVRCLACATALRLDWALPYARHVIAEEDRSASWNDLDRAMVGDDGVAQEEPLWFRLLVRFANWFFRLGDDGPPPPPPDRG